MKNCGTANKTYTHKTYPIACVRLDAGMYTREELLAAIEEMDIRNAKAIAAMRKTKEWVGLTDEELDAIYAGGDGTRTLRQIYQTIEAKFKEKNK
jgi:hypothetical protein